MAYGASSGGAFSTMKKSIPGAYINVVSAARTVDIMSERGKAAFPVELDWGPDKIVHLSRDDFAKRSMTLFGCPYNAPELLKIREVFCHATEIIYGRINADGIKATATIGDLTVTAKYAGTAGNRIKVAIRTNVDDGSKFDVITYMGTTKIDTQTASKASDLQDNDFVEFSGGALAVNAGVNLNGGTNAVVTGESYSDFLAGLGNETFNTLGYFGDDAEVKALFISLTRRFREEEGVKIQTVLYNMPADNEGIISVKNTDKLVPWVLGAEAGVSITEDNTSRIYDGELTDIPTSFDFELEKAAGHLLLFKDGDNYRLLEDINTLVTSTEEKLQEDFSSNKVIRTIDQIAIDTASIFNLQHLGKTPNNVAGRERLKADIVKHRRRLQDINAIEEFDPDKIKVEIGENKKTVTIREFVKITDMMKYLFMTVEVE